MLKNADWVLGIATKSISLNTNNVLGMFYSKIGNFKQHFIVTLRGCKIRLLFKIKMRIYKY